MVNAVALPALDSATPRERAQWRHALSPLLPLLPSALLLGVLRVWSLAVAPRHSVYFTAEALLVVYACFAIARAVHVNALSCDASGRYDARKAQKARYTFYAVLRRGWGRIALVVLPLLLAALVADMLTAGSGIQQRVNIHLSMMFVELMAWWRYGSTIAMAAAHWTPPRPPALARARCLASNARLKVPRTLAPAHLALTAAALASLAVYGSRTWASVFGAVPDARLVFVCSAALCAGFAWVGLWRLCCGSLAIQARLRSRGRGGLAGPATHRRSS
jgi:hypothetical protein